MADDIQSEDPQHPTSTPVPPPPAVSTGATDAAGSAATPGEADGVEYKVPGFASMEETTDRRTSASMDRFYEVHVPVWAELGRVEMPLGDLMKLDEGAVIRLDRPVSDPVDLVSQGVKLARGEVVVIDDCFAVRIKEMAKSK